MDFHTILWMKEAMNRLPENGIAEDVDKATILDYLAWAVYQVSEVSRTCVRDGLV